MTRIYHTWEKWECYPAGFYESQPPSDMTAREAQDAYANFLRNVPQFESAMCRLIDEWPNSCEHYLSNDKMNRIAWLGQAAVCIALGIPHGFRGGFNQLTQAEQQAANEAALRWLNAWLATRGEEAVTLQQAGIDAIVDLY